MMKVGVLSDVHGDLGGLQKALALLKAQQVAQVVCAGDLVNRGAHPNEVVALMRDAAIPCVRGNHDHYALLTLPDAADLWLHNADPAAYSHILSDETRGFLGTLPLTRRFAWEGKRVLLAHGVPWSYEVSLFPSSGARVFKQVAEDAEADVVILGHTHQPMVADVVGVRIVNAGAVWREFDDAARTCGVLTLPDGAFEVYDVDRRQTVKFAALRV